jgi:signal transduction histidine kinase
MKSSPLNGTSLARVAMLCFLLGAVLAAATLFASRMGGLAPLAAGALFAVVSAVVLALLWWRLHRHGPVDGEPAAAATAERARRLEEFVNHLQRARESEKSKLARHLHDELGSILIAAKMDAESVSERWQNAPPELVARLRRAQNSLEQAVVLKRQIIEELRPSLLDNLGLAAAVEWKVTEACRSAGLEYSLDVGDGMPIPAPLSIALFRVVQEGLANVAKHARARKVSVELVSAEQNISLLIEDDGVGISDDALGSPDSHGITGMRQQVKALGGEFRIHHGERGGTIIEANIPNPMNADPVHAA